VVNSSIGFAALLRVLLLLQRALLLDSAGSSDGY